MPANASTVPFSPRAHVTSPTPQLIEIKKYPNRRLYDSTRSRHVTHEEVYQLVIAGHTVRVTESKSEADITSLVLMQALIEHNPEKFAFFPAELVHLLIRASEQMLQGFASNWFTHTMASVMGKAASGQQAVANPMAANPMATMFPWIGAANPWSGMSNATASGTAPPTSASNSRETSVEDLEARLAAMMEEVARLKAKRS
jgi:polyhydroxyalkanoate synthesis repressor PhaR